MGLGIRGWRSVGLEVEMCGFRDHGWRSVGLEVKMCGFRNQGVETGRFRGGDVWV